MNGIFGLGTAELVVIAVVAGLVLVSSLPTSTSELMIQVNTWREGCTAVKGGAVLALHFPVYDHLHKGFCRAWWGRQFIVTTMP